MLKIIIVWGDLPFKGAMGVSWLARHTNAAFLVHFWATNTKLATATNPTSNV